MTNYQKLIDVVSSDSFWENDDFFYADELMYNFTSEEWELLKIGWPTLKQEAHENILASFNTNEAYYMRLLDFTHYLIQIQDFSAAQSTFHGVRASTYSEEEEESYLSAAYQLFQNIEDLRKLKSLKQKIWETGHSNKFLKRFDLSHWDEVFQLSADS